jgi:transposase InsO family protein
VYLATVIDGFSRKVVGWSVAKNMRTELVTDALTMAIRNRRPEPGSVVFHSDRGSQYTSASFRDLCLSNGIIPSVGNTGICFDNAAAESFNGWPPGLRSFDRTRCERCARRFPFAANQSCDGGVEEFVESTPNRASSSAIRAFARSSSADKPTTSAASSSYEGAGCSGTDTTLMIYVQEPEIKSDTQPATLPTNRSQTPSSTRPVNGHDH